MTKKQSPSSSRGEMSVREAGRKGGLKGGHTRTAARRERHETPPESQSRP